MSKEILRMENITKVFPGVRALDGVHLNIEEGKVMALIGENGAGKSTLMKILAGVYQRTEGDIYYKEKLVTFNSPKDSQDSGIAIIHQELNLIEGLSVGENIFLGREPTSFLNKINWKQMMSDSTKLLDELNIKINPKTRMKDISIGKQQMVEIAKALSLDAEIIIMDEPTDALTDTETESLFKVIKTLQDKGKSIIYISHRLREVFEICDDVTVLRDGKFVAAKKVSEINEDELIEMMVGRKLEEQYPYMPKADGDIILEVKNLSNNAIQDVSFQLKSGEILGVAGLMGAGRTELAKTLYGNHPTSKGEVILEGKTVKLKSEKAAIGAGITYVSEDRKKDGLILSMTVKENITIAALKRLSNKMVINRKKENEMVKEYIEKLSIKTPSPNQKVKNLSGGNQQKVSISKCLMTLPKVLLLDEPTRGVDVGAKKEIYDLMNEFKEEGMGILMVSSEIPELLGMCDRILVMHEGILSGTLNREDATQENIMRLAVGIKEDNNETGI